MKRASVYLGHMLAAAKLAFAYIDGMEKADFLTDMRTQQAAIMNLVIIGEAAGKLQTGHSHFLDLHPEVPWRSMQNMRNRIAHGYFDIDLDVVWDTLTFSIPQLLNSLPAIEAAARAEETPT